MAVSASALASAALSASAAAPASVVSLVHSSTQPAAPATGALAGAYSFAGLLAAQFLLDVTKNGGNLPAQVQADERRVSEARKLYLMYTSMALDNEMKILLDPDRASQRANTIAREVPTRLLIGLAS